MFHILIAERDAKTRRQLERALQKGGRDNVTIVLCEVQKQDSGRRLKTWLKGLKDKNER